MHHSMLSAATAAVALLAAVPAAGAGLYPKNSPVLQVDAKDYDRLIGKSNYTSVSTAVTLLLDASSSSFLEAKTAD